MIGSKTVDNIKSMTAAVDALTRSIKEATTAWQGFGTAAGTASKTPAGLPVSGSGTGGVGTSGRTMGLGTSGAKFTGLEALGALGKIGLGVAGAFYGGLPDTASVVSRAGGYYSAATFGGVNRTRLAQATFSGLGGGLTSIGADAAVAAILSRGIGMMPGSTAYNMAVAQVGGAARYLNMSNESAAAAIGGMQTGSMGANMYQYGIRTIDPRTGKPLTMAQIGRQIYNRTFQGKKVTAEDVAGSFQYGAFGANLRNLGLTSDQQMLFAQMGMDIASGRNPELSGKSAVGNPLAAQMQILTSQTQLMQDKEKLYLEGLQWAADGLSKLNKAMEGLPDIVFRTKAALDTIAGSDSGRALIPGGSIAGYAAWDLAKGAFKKFRGRGAAAAARAGAAAAGEAAAAGTTAAEVAAAGTTAATAGTAAASMGLGTAAAIVAAPLAVMYGAKKWSEANPLTAAEQEQWRRTEQGYAGQTAAYSQAYSRQYRTGGGNAGFGASFGPSGGAFQAQAPVQGVAATTRFGEKNPNLWKAGHTGQDYPVPEGTTVYAAADGTVMGDNPGSDYGVNVMIDHGNGYQTLYGHLSSKSVNVGDQVTRGQPIGKSGSTGNVTGPHLHFEVRKGKNNPVDPQEFLNGNLGSYGGSGSNSAVSSVLGNAFTPYDLKSSLFSSVSTVLNTNSPMAGDAGTSGLVLGTGDQQGWASKFLSQLGVPVTSENLKAMTTWMAYEGGHWKNSAHYNPLNTTQGADGATSMNKVGVKSYNSWEQGLQATIDTIRNGRYGDILTALQSGTDASAVLSAVNHSPWGTKIPGYGGGSAGFGGSFPGGGGSTVNHVTIKVEVARASEEEAVWFAKRVKTYLDTNNEISLMGSK